MGLNINLYGSQMPSFLDHGAEQQAPFHRQLLAWIWDVVQGQMNNFDPLYKNLHYFFVPYHSSREILPVPPIS